MRGATSMFLMATTSFLTLGLAIGCSSNPRSPEGTKAIESFQRTTSTLADAQKQVDAVTASLRSLSTTKDLPATYNKFKSQVADLKKTSAEARKRADAMRARQDEFVRKWQQEMASLQDPNLKSTLEQRRAAVSSNFERVRDAGQDARAAYEPFISTLDEILKALSIDPTPQTVAGIRPTLDRAESQALTLKQKLAGLQKELNDIQAGLASK